MRIEYKTLKYRDLVIKIYRDTARKVYYADFNFENRQIHCESVSYKRLASDIDSIVIPSRGHP